MLLRPLSTFLVVGLVATAVFSEVTEDKKLADDSDDEIEIVTASSAELPDDEPTGPFQPPDEQDMLKFEAKDAIVQEEGKEGEEEVEASSDKGKEFCNTLYTESGNISNISAS